jgi:hypothetical protein
MKNLTYSADSPALLEVGADFQPYLTQQVPIHLMLLLYQQRQIYTALIFPCDFITAMLWIHLYQQNNFKKQRQQL